MMTPKYSLMIAIVAVLALGFAGLAIAEDADATGEYKVTYTVSDRTYTVPSDTATVTLKTIAEIGASAPEGVSFDVWNDGTNKYSAGSTLIITSADKTASLTANWKPTEYTATFLAYDGKTVLGEPIKGTTKAVAADGVTISDATPKDLAKIAAGLKTDRDGYIFNGWMKTGADKPIATKDLGKLTADMTYTATYVVDYVVTFIDGDKTYVSSVSTLTVPDLGERTGFTFLGWYIGTEQVDPLDYEYKADTTFTSKWEPINCYVTFVAGETTVAVVAVLYGETVVEPKLPEGYAAWDFDFTKKITEDITVKATAITYKVVFLAGSTIVKEMTVVKGTVLKAEDAPAKVDGYKAFVLPTEPITKDITISADKEYGNDLSNPVILSIAIIVGVILLIFLAVLIKNLRSGKWIIGRAKKEGEE